MRTHLAQFRKAYAALAAGAAVVLASGLVTGSLGVWISAGIAAAGAALGVAVAPKNVEKPKDAGVAASEVLLVVVLIVVLILLFHGRTR